MGCVVTDTRSITDLPWLASLSSVERGLLDAASSRQVYPSGAMVFEPSEHPASVYLMDSGRVRIFRLAATGEEATLGYVAAGEVFGELPSFGAFPRESCARAQADSAIWKIRVDVFRELVRTHPDLAVEVTGQVVARMKRVESRVEGLILRDVRSRLAAALVEFAEHFGVSDGDTLKVEFRMSQAELGTLIGASRQSVNTAMMAFKDAGWLSQSDSTMVLLRPDLLKNQVRSSRSDI